MIRISRRALSLVGTALVGSAALLAACSGSGTTPSLPSASASNTVSAPCPTSQPPALPAGETRTVTVETEKMACEGTPSAQAQAVAQTGARGDPDGDCRWL